MLSHDLQSCQLCKYTHAHMHSDVQKWKLLYGSECCFHQGAVLDSQQEGGCRRGNSSVSNVGPEVGSLQMNEQ